jgi:hypothetical protein
MRGGVCRCLTDAYQRARVRGLTARRCRSCMRARALVCVRGRARICADACEHFPPPPSVVFSARRRSCRRRPSTRTSARGTSRESRRCPTYALPPARPRTAADCARPVVDALRGRCARRRRRCVRARARVRMQLCVVPSSSLCIQGYRCPLHTRVDLFHVVCTHRSVSTPPSCARARVCVCAWVWVCVCFYGGALHACKLRGSIDIPGESVTWLRKDVNISLRMCGSAVPSPAAAYARARAGPSCCARVCVGVVRRVYLARHPCVRYIKVYTWYSCATHARGCVSVPRSCTPTFPCARG